MSPERRSFISQKSVATELGWSPRQLAQWEDIINPSRHFLGWPEYDDIAIAKARTIFYLVEKIGYTRRVIVGLNWSEREKIVANAKAFEAKKAGT